MKSDLQAVASELRLSFVQDNKLRGFLNNGDFIAAAIHIRNILWGQAGEGDIDGNRFMSLKRQFENLFGFAG